MKRISLILLAAVIIAAVGINSSYASDQDVYQDSAAIKDLKNLHLLISLAQTGKATFKASTVVSQERNGNY